MARTYAAELATVVEALAQMTKQIDADRVERRVYEADARTDRETISRELQQQRHAQELIASRLAAVEPVTSMVTSLQSKITGAFLVLGFIGAVAWGGVVFFRDAIMRFLEGGG